MADTAFHGRFVDALRAPDSASLPLQKSESSKTSERRFNVYRNNRVVSLIDALRCTYPVIAQLVGDEFFKASARAYVDANPPVQPVMAEYGECFGRFIGSLPTTAKLPFLRDIAELEWCRLQAFHCADGPTISTVTLAEIDPAELMRARLVPHSALRIVRSKWPIHGIWFNCSHPQDETPEVNMNRAEGVVITRPAFEVHSAALDSAAVVFTDGLCAGKTIEDAASAALAIESGFDVGRTLLTLIDMGAFAALELKYKR